MKVLDCESIESIYSSIETILEIDRNTINMIFQNLDIDRFYADSPDYPESTDKLVFSTVTHKALSDVTFQKVCWFHLTRAPVNHTFDKEGILPLGLQINSIWDFLYSLLQDNFSPEVWNKFRRELSKHHPARLYHMKVNNPSLWGPYAVLIRDVAFKSAEVGNHDYLRTPEIVEDICMCFSHRFGFDLLGEFIENTRPCIVKFTDDKARSDCLTTALYHLYAVYHKHELSLYNNTCFDGKGLPIPKEHILKIEFPLCPAENSL